MVHPISSLSFFAVTAWLGGVARAGSDGTLVGTWSTGSEAVVTGSNFSNPLQNTFTYPPTAGMSLSFTSNGFFEQAEFTWDSNSTDPHCVSAVILWQHGTYEITSGGVTIDPSEFSGDGRIQVQDTCGKISNGVFLYSQAGLYKTWAVGPWRGKTSLQLGAFDGSLLSRMYLVSDDPTQYMHPTISLSNSSNTLSGRRRRYLR